ncbi:hypothetical protein [Paraburkholderia atlantica]|nr:hypothetical protein [Paraburkholderia atlantica]
MVRQAARWLACAQLHRYSTNHISEFDDMGEGTTANGAIAYRREVWIALRGGARRLRFSGRSFAATTGGSILPTARRMSRWSKFSLMSRELNYAALRGIYGLGIALLSAYFVARDDEFCFYSHPIFCPISCFPSFPFSSREGPKIDVKVFADKAESADLSYVLCGDFRTRLIILFVQKK